MMRYGSLSACGMHSFRLVEDPFVYNRTKQILSAFDLRSRSFYFYFSFDEGVLHPIYDFIKAWLLNSLSIFMFSFLSLLEPVESCFFREKRKKRINYMSKLTYQYFEQLLIDVDEI